MADYSKGRILLVDDEPIVLEMFESFLSQAGYHVSISSNATDALVNIERNFYDAVVCDVTLEEFDGFDILMISRKKNQKVGVVLITGAPFGPDAEKAKQQNAVYLSKPLGSDTLIDAVQESISLVADKKAQAT